jgi:hypothetical protein
VTIGPRGRVARHWVAIDVQVDDVHGGRGAFAGNATAARGEGVNMKLIGRVIAILSGLVMVISIGGAIVAVATRRRSVVVDAPDADDIHLAAVVGPLGFASTAAAFRGGTIDTFYGGGIVDLRGATLDPAGATLRVRAIFGGAQIVLPAEWRLVTAVRGLGGVGDSRPSMERPTDAPTLRIEGLALFGGFGITSDVPAGAVEKLEAAMEARAGAPASQAAEPVPLAG